MPCNLVNDSTFVSLLYGTSTNYKLCLSEERVQRQTPEPEWKKTPGSKSFENKSLNCYFRIVPFFFGIKDTAPFLTHIYNILKDTENLLRLIVTLNNKATEFLRTTTGIK